MRTRSIFGAEQRRHLREGRPLLRWFTPAADKSTIAYVLLVKPLEPGGRRVTLLDEELVRKHLSAGLGFSRADWDGEVSANGGVAICPAITPYDETRRRVCTMVDREAGFVPAHMATPVGGCEARDRKAQYAKAYASLLSGLPVSPTPTRRRTTPSSWWTSVLSAEQAADCILVHLQAEGYLAGAVEGG